MAKKKTIKCDCGKRLKIYYSEGNNYCEWTASCTECQKLFLQPVKMADKINLDIKINEKTGEIETVCKVIKCGF